MTPDDNPTRARILDAATAIFAERGYEGARVDEIARAAGVNKATLYYQVGDKEALYHAGITLFLRRTADQVEEAIAGVEGCEERVRRFIGVIARNSGALHYASRMMLREIASGGRNLPDTALPHMGRMLGVLGDTLAEGIARGLFREVDRFFVHMMIVGSLMLYAVNAPIRERMARLVPPGRPGPSFLTTAEAAAEVSDLVLAAIRIHPPQESTP